MEILFKKLIFRFLIASDMGWKPKYSLLFHFRFLLYAAASGE